MKKVLFLLIIFILVSCAKRTEKSLLIMCGSANKPAMEEISKIYTENTGIKINMIFGGSGTLLSQIELSHKGDIYIPGSPDFITKAEKKRLIFSDTVKRVSYLIPAIIVPKGNPADIQSFSDLAKPGIKVGIGNPENVCLGLYGIELLEKNNLLESVLKNVVTFGGSCSKTANLAALSKVDAIIGWRVFHYWNKDKMDYIPIEKNKIPRISYIPISVPIYTQNKEESIKFINFVVSKTGKDIYKKWGYVADKETALSFSEKGKIGGEYKLSNKYYKIINSPK